MMYDPLTPLDPQGKPTPEAIRNLHRELYTNARRNQTYLGGGRHGHLGLLMPDHDYILISHTGESYAIPERPDIPGYTVAGDGAEHATMSRGYDMEL
jgi:hypothetical protein